MLPGVVGAVMGREASWDGLSLLPLDRCCLSSFLGFFSFRVSGIVPQPPTKDHSSLELRWMSGPLLASLND